MFNFFKSHRPPEKIPEIRVKIGFFQEPEWTNVHAQSLDAFLKSPPGQHLLNLLEADILLRSNTIAPLTKRADGIRQGMAMTLYRLRELARVASQVDDYDPQSDLYALNAESCR